jgi:hypothetical protein
LLTGSMSRPRKVCSRPTAKGETEVMDERLQATGAACPRRHDAIGEAFGEYSLPASHSFAVEAADIRHQFHRAPRQGQVRDLTAIAAVDTATDTATFWALARRRSAADQDRRAVVDDRRTHNGKARWDHLGWLKRFLRGIAPKSETAAI